ncbi:hypothetical protein DV736_g5348, partial [Chaetothyriales sp. CBS 134916]
MHGWGLPPPSLLSWRTYVPFLKPAGSSSNYPTPRSLGPFEWIRDQIDKLRNRRTARGAYEETSSDLAGGETGAYRSAGGSHGGRGRGLEDDAWDTRVGGDEADPYRYAGHEEQELGLAHPAPVGLHAEPYGSSTDYVGGDGRGRLGPDPFGDHNEAESLRSVSPRPHENGHTRGQVSIGTTGSGGSGGSGGEPASLVGTRKSAFREDM